MLITRRPIGRADYEAARAWGISTAVYIYGCDPETIGSQDCLRRFTRELCDLLEVRRFGETQVVRLGADPRARGYSMIQLIETAYGFDCGSAVIGVYGHLMVQLVEMAPDNIAEGANAVYLEIFSCKWYDEQGAAEFARKFFRAGRIRMQTRLCAEARRVGIGVAR